MALIDNVKTYGGLARALPKLMPWSKATPTTQLEERARSLPDHLALAFQDDRFTWREVDEHANQWAQVLHSMGVGPGDVVALLMDNRPDFLFAVHGLGKLGAAAALINTNLTGAPLAHAINVGNARKVIAGDEHLVAVLEILKDIESLDVDRGLLLHADGSASPSGAAGELLNPLIDAAPATRPTAYTPSSNKELFVYIYTSGTTGLPKAAIISGFRALGAGTMMSFLMTESRPGDVVYVPLPLYHSSAMFLGWCGALMTGSGIAVRRKFSVRYFWDDVRKFGATRFIYIGELCRYLLNAPPSPGDRDHKIKFAVGNGLRPDIWEEFQSRFGITQIREFYGSTEGTAAIMNRTGKPGMVGRLQFGQILVKCDQESGEPVLDAQGHCREIEVGEIGLLLARITNLLSFDGYVDRKASSKKVMEGVFKDGDRWFNTGDLLQLHEDKWLSFADRVGDTFRWKGENVSTNEVAEVCNGAPRVLETNVYGVTVPGADGRAGMAALSAEPGFDLDTFAQHVMENLPGYQRPLFVRMLAADMQTTATLKHQKVSYRREAFDPGQVSDPLYYLEGGSYRVLDADAFARIESGEIRMS